MAGAPRFKHKGKVILFELSDDGDVDIAQALNGEQVVCVWVCVCVFQVFFPFQKLSVSVFGGQNREIKTRRPSTGRPLSSFLFLWSFGRLGLTMAARCAGWMLTRTASLIYF